jgi:integrase
MQTVHTTNTLTHPDILSILPAEDDKNAGRDRDPHKDSPRPIHDDRMGQISQEILEFLLGDHPMKGTIRTKEKCPVCAQPFASIPKLGLVCLQHKTTPKKFYLDVFWKGQQKIFSNKRGEILDSYSRALEVQLQVTREIEEKTFDPTKYRRQEIEKFYSSNLLSDFLKKKLKELAPSNKATFRRILTRAMDHFGSRDVREIRKLDLVRFKEWLEDLGITAKTLKNHLDCFRSFLRWCAADLEILDRVPATPELEIPPAKWKWISRDDQIKLLEFVPPEDRPIISFLMLHGCRPGEARAIRCSDVNLEAGTITIQRTFSGRVLHEKRKGRGSKPLVMPIHSQIFDFVKDRVQGALPGAWLFARGAGVHYTQNKLGRIWTAVRAQAGIEGLRLYDATRHSFASQLVNDGQSLLNVSRLMGHSETRMTERYAHSSVQGLRATLEKMSLNKVVEFGSRTGVEPKAENGQKR